jgi:hypothetical protein
MLVDAISYLASIMSPSSPCYPSQSRGRTHSYLVDDHFLDCARMSKQFQVRVPAGLLLFTKDNSSF